MVIKEMTLEDADAWFDFFDNRAFAGHPEWKGCFCTGPFTPRLEGYQAASRKRRDYAHWLMEQGLMKGYLAFDEGKIVGWCDVNEKSLFSKYNDIQTAEKGVIAITCFVIQEQYRGQGLAGKILQKIIEDAKRDKKRIIEAYPRPKAKTSPGNFHGPYSMYQKNGFVLEKVHEMEVVRRYL